MLMIKLIYHLKKIIIMTDSNFDPTLLCWSQEKTHSNAITHCEFFLQEEH